MQHREDTCVCERAAAPVCARARRCPCVCVPLSVCTLAWGISTLSWTCGFLGQHQPEQYSLLWRASGNFLDCAKWQDHRSLWIALKCVDGDNVVP